MTTPCDCLKLAAEAWKDIEPQGYGYGNPNGIARRAWDDALKLYSETILAIPCKCKSPERYQYENLLDLYEQEKLRLAALKRHADAMANADGVFKYNLATVAYESAKQRGEV